MTQKNLTLIVETSLSGVAIMLFSDECERTEIYPFPGDSTDKLVSLVTKSLTELDCKPNAIKKILISVGPGSFTGIKIGLSWIYGWKAAFPQIPIASVSGLESALKEISHSSHLEKSLALFLPSTKTHGFVSYEYAGEIKTELIDLTKNDLNHLKNHIWMVFSGWENLMDKSEKWNLDTIILEPKELLKKALTGMKRHCNSKESNWSVDQLPIPNYLRQPTVLEKLQAH